MAIPKPPFRNIPTPGPAAANAIEFRNLLDRVAALEERAAALEDVIRIQRSVIEIQSRVPLRISAPLIEVSVKGQKVPLYGHKIGSN